MFMLNKISESEKKISESITPSVCSANSNTNLMKKEN